MRLQDRVVIITGGGRGIGAATAQAIAGDGGKVVIGDMLEAEGEATAAAIRAAGRRCRLCPHRYHERGGLRPAGGGRRRAARQAGRAHLLRGDPAGRHTASGGAGRGHLRERPRCQPEGDLSHGEGGPAPPPQGGEGRGAVSGLGGGDQDPQFIAGLRRQQGGRARLHHDAGGAARAARHSRQRDLPVEHRDPHADRKPG